ncbi:MAG TPA: hypothetical protein VEX15_15945 [Nocardioidaceae bacterium]|nr:hypothetical protein [Nocardioidaceae bacterium]
MIVFGLTVLSASYISSWSAKLPGASLPSTATRPVGSPASTWTRSVAVIVPDWPGGKMSSTRPYRGGLGSRGELA